VDWAHGSFPNASRHPCPKQTLLEYNELEFAAKTKDETSGVQQNEFPSTLTSGFISRRPKEKLKITAVESAYKLPMCTKKRRHAIKLVQESQQWLQ
jgi:hypothetical protein